MDTILVILIVGVAAAYTARTYIKKYKGENECACGGTCSSQNTDCGMIKNKMEIENTKQK